MRFYAFMPFALALAGCSLAGRQPVQPLVVTPQSPSAFAESATGDLGRYRIGPSDKLVLRVFQVPDLSFEEIYVDAGGSLQLPLLGSVQAAGLTTSELAASIADGLRTRYVRNPQVMVTVAEAASQKVTVDGAVVKPGVYEMRGRTTLVQALAMAEGATRTARLDRVAVFRKDAGRDMVAVFDLKAIRSGTAQDPVLLGDDIVVVDTSQLSARLQEILQALPGVATFFYYLP